MEWTPNQLRKFREFLGGIDQKELAEMLGVGESTVMFWERRPSEVATRLLNELAEKNGFTEEESS